MKNKTLKIISAFCAVIVAAVSLLCSCAGNDEKLAVGYVGENGKTEAGIDQKTFSLIVAIVNFQLGADSLEAQMWDMPYQEGVSTTAKEIVMAQSRAYAKGLVQAEHLCDKVYGIGLSDEQSDSIDEYISSVSSRYGSEKNLENALSVYGADVAALKRYMELVIKQDTLYKSFYTENGIRREVLEQKKPEYFSEHFVICDHILIKYSGAAKDDGTQVPLTEQEKLQKKEVATALYNEIVNGVRDFDEALGEYNEDTYKLGFPFGYFVPDNFYWSGISEKVQDAAHEMKEGEIRLVDTQDGAYIVRRNKMDTALYASNGDFETYMESALSQEDFLLQCESADGAVLYDDVIDELNPVNIPSFNIDMLSQ